MVGVGDGWSRDAIIVGVPRVFFIDLLFIEEVSHVKYVVNVSALFEELRTFRMKYEIA